MVGIDAIFNHVTVARLVADHLEDVDIRQISLDGRLDFFDSLPKSYWSKRAKKKYQDCEFERRLADQLPLRDVQDYGLFVYMVDSVKRCETKFKMKTFFTQQLENGPGTEPILRGRTALSNDLLVWSSSLNGSIVMDTLTDTVRLLTSHHLNIRFFGAFMIGWENGAPAGDPLLSLYNLQTLALASTYKPDTSVEKVFLNGTDRVDTLVLTENSIPNENNLYWLTISTVRVENGKLSVTRLVRRQVDTNLFIGAYAIHCDRVFCMAHQNDANRQQLAILAVGGKEEDDASDDSSAAEFEYVDFAGTVAKTHLSSELLKDDGFTCWQPIQMDSAQMPVFVVAFGCKMRFRSFYSGIPIFRHCRSACFATFSDSSRTRLTYHYLPVKMYFDLFIHEGFVQVVHPERPKTFGSFYKFVTAELAPKMEVCEMPISEDLDAFFPQDSSKVSFSVAGVASQDSVLLTIRTWPSRSAADISVKHRIAHFKFLSEHCDDTTDESALED